MIVALGVTVARVSSRVGAGSRGRGSCRGLSGWDAAVSRGRSPVATSYVDAGDGHAVVIKAGSNISKFGEIDIEGADWIEKAVFDELDDKYKLQSGDVLLSSTGTGTLGKASVWRDNTPAIADGHVTIIRCDAAVVDPTYLADYLRTGFGHVQIERLYTGSTGLIELTREHVDAILVDLLEDVEAQQAASATLRQGESSYRDALHTASASLADEVSTFRSVTSAQSSRKSNLQTPRSGRRGSHSRSDTGGRRSSPSWRGWRARASATPRRAGSQPRA